ncbi:hypothetical protein [Agrobacterium rubi]|uniref:hypothetical protein n=1 Tax=Agrobacterium rubi TaxID=28099 RepID=UPI001571A986|nr:hypothetical protein [Agrobacterium rubi]NTE87185.1 hypothetical protein [Agrobacterium rubi]NTF03119.1 hypothetical protein [Agrobacterium rubi]
MALATELSTHLGTATYHRIRAGEMTFAKQPLVSGAEGSAIITIDCYADQAARDANLTPMFTRTVRIYFGKDVCHEANVKSGDGDPPTVLIVKEDEPTRSQFYDAIKALPEFENAESV